MKKILVTGGLGYIGSHTVVELIESGFEPVIIDDLSNSERFVLDRIEEITGKKPVFYEINLLNEIKLNKVFEENHFEGIIHFAAFKAVGESVEKPILYYKNNLGVLLNVLSCMNQYKLDNIINSSSCTVYGQAEKMPIDETFEIKKAFSPYAKTKIMGEEIITDFVETYHKNAVSLRYFNPIGAHKSAKIGELPKGIPNNLVPFITQTAAGIREELAVFGNDFPTLDGFALRDYIYVVDLAKAHVLAMNRLINKENKLNHEFFNLGTGKGHTVFQVIEAFEKATGISIKYTITSRRKGDIATAYANADLAKKELNWQANTSIEESLKSAWEWQKTLPLPN